MKLTLNQVFIAVFLLLLVLLFVSIGVFYVRHWTSRQMRRANVSAVEGVFFKRYVPEPLRETYDLRREAEHRRAARRMGWAKAMLVLAMIVLSLGLTGAMLEFGWDHMTWIRLTDAERSALDYQAYQWSRESDQRLPALAAMLPALRKGGVALLLPSLSPRQQAAAGAQAWEDFLNGHGVLFNRCLASNLEACPHSAVYVVPPGEWALPALDRLLAQGASVLLYGPPAQTTRLRKSLEFHGLRFVPRYAQSYENIMLVGDRALTLGFDAGLNFPLSAAFNDYAAYSERPQAVELDNEDTVGGELLTRLYARKVGHGRFVWMDFSPNLIDHDPALPAGKLNALLAAVFRYLLRSSYSAWATWPQGKAFAATFSVDTEFEFTNAAKIADFAERERLPITWFVVSNLAQVHRRLLRRLDRVGEVECHCDAHISFLNSTPHAQVVRIARCRKVVATLTHTTARGFRPPYEEYDDATIDAVADNGMSFFFAEAGGDRAVPTLIRTRSGSHTLVSLPRMGSDDYAQWYTEKLGYASSVRQLRNEAHWIRAVGGILMYDFHTQYVSPAHLRVIGDLVHTVRKTRRVYLSTAADVSRWWRLRVRLMRGEPITAADVCRYRPSLLVMGANGVLTRITDAGRLKGVPAGALPPDAQAWAAAQKQCQLELLKWSRIFERPGGVRVPTRNAGVRGRRWVDGAGRGSSP